MTHPLGTLVELTTPTPGVKTPIWGTGVHVKLPGRYATHGGANAYFDTEPTFPCWALLIHRRSALILRPKDNELGDKMEWVRIGIARTFYSMTNFFDEGAAQAFITSVKIV